MFLYNVCRKYMSYHIMFEGIYVVLSYPTHIWSAYVAGNLLKIKKREKMKHVCKKDKTRLIILKRLSKGDVS